MNKLKTLFSKMSNDARVSLKKFPLTTIIICAITLLFLMVIDLIDMDEDILIKCVAFGVTFGFGTYFSEILSDKLNLKRIFCYIISFLISLFFIFRIEMNENENIFAIRLRIVYLITIFMMSFFINIRNKKMTVSEYAIKMFRNLFNCTIIYGILAAGLSLILIIFVELILDGVYGESLYYLHIALAGFYYATSVFYAISVVNEDEVNGFIKNLITKVLLLLASIAVVIIYIYLVKILILRNMPKNFICRILFAVFVAVFPISVMANYYSKENNFICKLTKILNIAYIPFIILEIYSISVRVNDYGITETRYFAIAFIILQSILIALYLIKNQKYLNYAFVAFAVLSIICVVSPINYENVSKWSQACIIKFILPKGNEYDKLEENESKEKLKSAYQYLKNTDNLDAISYIEDSEIEKIKSFETTKTQNYGDYGWGFRYKEFEEFDVSEYTKMKMIDLYDINSAELEIDNVKIDLSEFVAEIIKEEEKDYYRDYDEEGYFVENNIIYFENGCLYIKNFNVQYNKSDLSFVEMDVDGYIFTK